MGYSAGDLSVELFGIDTNAVASIDNTAKALKRLSSALKSIEKLQSIFIGNKIENIFDSISRATNSINTTNIEKLASASQSLASLTKISKLQDLDYGKIGSGFENLTTAITPFIDKIKTAETSLVALYGTLSKASGKKMQNLFGDGSKPNSKNKGSFSFLNLAKWGAVIYSARRLGRVVANIAQKGADYTETLNLWETAMSGNLDLATKFVDKMNEAYGISKKTLMNAQATFKNMLGSLGQISESTAYALSEGITQMAIDYASLYNVNFEKAFEKFQAVLAGQVRPIRSVSGYDITENTLFELYKQLGGTKSVRNLSRTEKQLLSILAIFNQMQASGAIGDLDKTIDSFANQSRIMSEAWKDMLSYAGILVTYLVQESGLLTYISATLMYITDFLKGVAESLGAIQSFGGDVFGDTTESIYGTSDALDELNGKLLDFDKFRALNENEENGIGLDEKLLTAFKQYETILASATNNARELANSWKETGTNNLLIKLFESIYKIIDFIANDTRVSSFFVMLGDELGKLIDFLGSDIFSSISDLIINIFQFVASIYPILKPLFNILSGIFEVVDSIIQLVSQSFETLSYFAELWVFLGTIFEFVGDVLYTILRLISALIDSITALLSLDWGRLGDIWGSFGSDVGNAWKNTSGVKIGMYADGGLPDKGTMFVAGEAGAEMVYNTPSGQSGVVNVQQIKQAMLGALIEYGQSQGGNQPIEVYLDGELVYRNTTAHAKKRGQVWGTV